MKWYCLSSDYIRTLSLFEVDVDILSLEDDKLNSICSKRLGPRIPNEICGTCGIKTCVEPHYAHINLPEPVILKHFEPQLRSALKQVCLVCKQPADFSLCEKMCKYPKKVVFHSEEECIEDDVGEVHLVKRPRTKNFSDNSCHIDEDNISSTELMDMLNNMSWNEKESHPKCYLADCMLVIPNSLRMWTKDDQNMWKSHHWSNSYRDIFLLCKRFKQGDTQDLCDKIKRRIYIYVNRLIDIKSVKKTTNSFERKPFLRTLVDKNKTGLIRGSMMGKVVENCARAVVIGDSGLPMNYIGIPEGICNKLFFPERINHLNRETLLKSMEKGNIKSLIHPDSGREMIVRPSTLKICIKEFLNGRIVERKLQDGDVAVINRQPTLHRGSMIAFYIRRVKGHAIRINPINAAPFNADYDGDEMNLHIPRSYEAKAEMITLMGVQERIVGDSGSVQIGLVQNPLLGIYRLTLPNTHLNRGDYCQLLGKAPLVDKSIYSGIELVSHLLNEYELPPIKGITRDGKLIGGPLTSKSIGGGGMIILHIFTQYGQMKCMDVLDKLQKLGDQYLSENGASVGIGDVIFDHHRADELVSEEHVNMGSVRLALEEEAEHIAQEDNGMVQMANSGSKGSLANLLPISVCMGQLDVNGQDIPRYIKDERILPTMKSSDTAFVKGNLIKGLEPSESALTQLNGRCGIAYRSICTATSGKTFRDMTYRWGSYVVAYDNTVRDSQGFICQFLYGDDGVDPRFESSVIGEGFVVRNNLLFAQFKKDPKTVYLQPGEPVGAVAAHAFGQPVTQATLNSMHGQNKMEATRKPRLEELLNVTLHPEKTIIQIPLNDLEKHQPRFHLIKSWVSSEERPLSWWDEEYQKYFGTCPYEAHEYLTISFKKEELEMRGIHSCKDLIQNCTKEYYCTFSPWMEKIIVTIYLPQSVHVETFLHNTFICPLRIRDIKVTGSVMKVETINSIAWAFEMFPNQAYFIRSTNVVDVHKNLGIHAARKVMFRELNKIDSLKGKVSQRHISFLCDSVFYRGVVMGINYRGIKQANSSTMVTSSYRDPIKTFILAATKKKDDGTRNMFTSLAVGDTIPMGTGFDFDVYQEEEEYEPAPF